MKNSNYKLQIFVIILLVLSLGLVSPVFGATSTSSAKASPKMSPSPQATASASLLQKINEIKEKAASKASELLSEVTKKMQNKAYFGVITSVDGDKVTVSFAGKDYTIVTNEYTAFTSSIKTAKKITALKDFTAGEFVSGLGDADDKGVLKAKRLVKSTPVATDSTKLVWGVIQKATGGTITIKQTDSTDQVITASGQTPVFLGAEEGSLLDVKVGRTLIARGKQTSNAGLTSSYIYVVPQSNTDKPEKKPQPSFSASPSASPKKR